MIYFCPDLHIGRRLRNLAALRDDGHEALRRLADVIVEDAHTVSGPHVVVLPGDVFDKSRANGEELHIFRAFCERFPSAEFQIEALAGNHDMGNPAIPSAQGVHSLDAQQIESNGICLHGMDYCSRPELLERLTQVPACDVLVLHCTMEHLAPYEGAWTVSMEEIPAQVRNVVAGDIHQFSITDLPDGRGKAVSPGVLFPGKMDEYVENGHGVVRWDGQSEWELLPIAVRRIERCTLFTEVDVSVLQNQLDKLPDIVEELRPVFDVRHVVEWSDTVDRMVRSYEGKAVIVGSIVGQFAEDSPNLLGDDAQKTTDELLAEELAAEDDEDARQFAKSLLHAADTGELRKFLTESVEQTLANIQE